jgi:hypothetical protein
MTKKVRIKAWQENGDSAINMTNRLGRLGHQKLKKRVSSWPKSFYALEGNWHHQEWGGHAPRHNFIHRFLNVLLTNMIFAFGAFFCSRKSCKSCR